MRSATVRGLLPSLLTLVAVLPAGATDPPGADTQPDARMLRYPDVSATHIAFVYADDIWLVPRDGGMALPLARPAGPEMFPRFSPDGSPLAFVGNYEGNRDLYVLPMAGGIATRVTHHPVSEMISDCLIQVSGPAATSSNRLPFASTNRFPVSDGDRLRA